MGEVLWSGHIFSQQRSGGISRYWAELIREMANLKPEFKMSLCLPRSKSQNIFLPELLLSLQSSRVSIDGISRFWQRSKETQILHSPYMFGPESLTGATCILTVHDLIHRKLPAKSLRTWIRVKALDFSIARADAYICVSEATKGDLYKFYPSARQKPCRVIYHGVNNSQTVILPQESGFVLYVGQRSGYKNFRILLEALAYEPGLKQLQLICAGGPDFSEKENQLTLQLGIKGRIQHRARVSDAELQGLYQKALVLVYPSIFEGFGLPILEAMAQSCPVVCLSDSSMGEIAAGFHVSFDSNDRGSLARTLLQLKRCPLDKSHLAKARQHAEGFSWARAAQQTTNFYAEVLAAR